MKTPLTTSQADQLIAAYLDGALSEKGRSVFEQWLKQSRENCRRVARWAATDFALREVCQASKEDYLIDILRLIDRQSEPGQLVRIPVPEPWWKSPSVIAAGGAIAAALLIAVTLVIVYPGDKTAERTDAVAGTQQQTTQQQSAQSPTGSKVATLTAQRDAKWQQADGAGLPGVGDGLWPGQTLALTDGFAQITTRRGAVANLEAPATIELLDDGNAIRLHRGKLVGICETESSKGFLVRTPHMDITDLGTRFGVDATRADTTEVHVIEGEVTVGMPRSVQRDGAVAQRVLSIGQAIAAEAGRNELVVVDQDESRFAAIQHAELVALPNVSGIAGVRSITGDLKAASSSAFIGKNAKQWPVDNDAFIFEEFVGRAPADLLVGRVLPGKRLGVAQIGESQIPADTPLRSYIILAKPSEPGTVKIVTGSVRFDGEVVGVIVQETRAAPFDKAMGGSATLFRPGTNSYNWLDPHNFDEYLSLSEDRRSLTFSMQSKQSVDTIRVLVQTEEADRQPSG